MKKILCFGDSNTYGFIPSSGKRYDENSRKLYTIIGFETHTRRHLHNRFNDNQRSRNYRRYHDQHYGHHGNIAVFFQRISVYDKTECHYQQICQKTHKFPIDETPVHASQITAQFMPEFRHGDRRYKYRGA